jgi:hypothetical protein
MATTQPKPDDELNQLRKIQRRCPRFYGIRPSPDGLHWTASVRDTNHKERILGTEFESESQAWAAYQAAPKYRRKDPVESAAHVNRLLRAASAFPVQFRTEASLHGSSMNPYSADWRRAMTVDSCGEYETAKKR